MIDKQIQQELRDELEKKHAELAEKIAELSKPVDMGDDIDSFDEETDEAEEYSTNIGAADALKRSLARVKDALAKIDAGSYGTCEGCGQKIELELLRVDPESRLCRQCKLKKRE